MSKKGVGPNRNADRYLHCCLEEHIETVIPLNEFKCNDDEEEFLTLYKIEACATAADHESRRQGSDGNYSVEQVPAVGTKACESKSIKPYDNIDNVNGGNDKEPAI